MDKQEQITQAVSDYLNHHRYDPPERDGWFSMWEIKQGVNNELDFTLRSLHVLRATDALMATQPPKVEDVWMLSNSDGTPRLESQYQHPEQPDKARRFYRVVSPSVEYIDPS
ncbi:MAG TPA: hypothetical protein VJR27_00720 [Candidatus Saccharimonadales bacterium]|nr:hypothetical protein [Candidatus Saccharimonadales bacterium]